MCSFPKDQEVKRELRYHETMRDRVAVEGWWPVLFYPTIKANLGWALFLVVLFSVARINRSIPRVMFVIAPTVGVFFGCLGTITRVLCGRDLTIGSGYGIAITEQGRRRIYEMLTKVESVEFKRCPGGRLTIQFAFTPRRQRPVRFTTKCTLAEEEQIRAVLENKQVARSEGATI